MQRQGATLSLAILFVLGCQEPGWSQSGADASPVAATKLQLRTPADQSRTLRVTPLRNMPEHGGTVGDVAFSADGRLFATIGQDLRVKICDAQTARVVRELIVGEVVPESVQYYATSVAFAPHGSLLAVGVKNAVHLYDAETGALQKRITHETVEKCDRLRFSAAGDRLVSSGLQTLAVWSLPGGEFSHSFKLPSLTSNNFALTPDGNLAACPGREKSVDLLDLKTGSLVYRFEGAHAEHVLCVAINGDGTLLAAADFGRRLVVYDLTTKTERFRHDDERYWALAFSPDGVLAGGFDGIDFYLVGEKQLHPLPGLHRLSGASAASVLCFSPDGRRLATERGFQDRAEVFEVEWSQEERTLCTVPRYCSGLAASRDGRLVAWADYRTLKLFSTADGKEIASAELPESPDSEYPMDFSRDGSRLLVRLNPNSGKTVQVFQLPNLKLERSWKLKEHYDARFTPEGNDVLLFEFYYADPQPIASETVAKVEHVAVGLIQAQFAEQGNLLIGHRYHDIGVYGWPGKNKLHYFPTGRYIEGYSISPDVAYMAVFSANRKIVRVWNLAKEDVIAEIEADPQKVYAVAFTGDGRGLLTLGTDGLLKVWSCDTWKLRAASPAFVATNEVRDAFIATVPHSSQFYTCTNGGHLPEGSVRQWDLAKLLERIPQAVEPTDVIEPPFTGALALHNFEASQRYNRSAGFTENGLATYYLDSGDELVLFDLNAQKERWRLQLEDPTWIDFTSDGRTFAVSFDDKGDDGGKANVRRGTVKIYDAPTRRVQQTLTLDTREPQRISFSPDGRTLAVASGTPGGSDERAGELSLWDVVFGRRTTSIPVEKSTITRVRFSPDGALLAYCEFGEQVCVWDLQANQLRFRHRLKPKITDVQFSPDGKWLAVCCGEWDRGQIALYDAATGVRQPWLNDFNDEASAIAISPQGNVLVAACRFDDRQDGYCFWSVPDGKELRRVAVEQSMSGHGAISFSPNGTRFAGNMEDHFQVWRVDHLLDVPLQRAIRQMTDSCNAVRYEGDVLLFDHPAAVERELARFPAVSQPFMVNFHDSDDLTDAGLVHLAKQPNLVGLDISRCEKTTLAGLSAVRSLPLRKLACFDLYATPVLLKQQCFLLRETTTLEDLTLGTPTYFDEGTGIAGLEKLVRLRSLHFDVAAIRGPALQPIGSLPLLKNLVLESCSARDDDLKYLAPLKTLRSLRLEAGEGFTGAGLAHLAGCTELAVLNLENSRHLTDDGIRSLRHFPKLRDLNLHYSEVTDAGLAVLKNLSELERLDLPETITDAGLAHVGSLAKLRELKLSGEKELTGAGVAHLVNLQALETLDFGLVPLTDAAVPHLAKLKSLRRLVLYGNKFTEAGAKQLRDSFPPGSGIDFDGI